MAAAILKSFFRDGSSTVTNIPSIFFEPESCDFDIRVEGKKTRATPEVKVLEIAKSLNKNLFRAVLQKDDKILFDYTFEENTPVSRQERQKKDWAISRVIMKKEGLKYPLPNIPKFSEKKKKLRNTHKNEKFTMKIIPGLGVINL